MTEKVFFVISDLGTGGTARATTLVVNGLAEAGIDVALVVGQRGGVHEAMLEPRVRLLSLDLMARRGAMMLLGVGRLARLLHRERPTKLISAGNHMHVLAATAHALARVPGSELILKMTNPVERPGTGRLKNAVRRGWYGRAFRQASKILLIAESARGELGIDDPATARKVLVVDNPYVTDAMIAAGEQPRQAEPGRLLAIGRLVPQKNYGLMLSALARIDAPDWSLDVLGDGPQRSALERQVSDLGIGGRVRFHGFVMDPVPFLRRSAALLLSSSWEGQGAVLLEALACGCPVVATRSSSAVGAVLGEGRYGRLTPPNDVQAFADAVRAELRQPSRIEGVRAWVERYRLQAGVDSHARALGLVAREGVPR
ncbi:glycosyltransferase [Sphingomonas sp. URHD0057]|uniref:glycosyltransferase n=1 Tax=Sphingomonas sp. URHD0057 TaxID=1380389 RepID=UPI000491F1DA|nr:glycosyltransferase [Sphingomonas sp. URHD0057]